jgi:hypothetical protein
MGKLCQNCMIATPKDTRTGRCSICDGKAKKVARPSRWDIAFDWLAEKIQKTGRLHHLTVTGSLRATTIPAPGDPYPACRRAAQLTKKTGRLHCLRVTRWGFAVDVNVRSRPVSGIDD